MQSRLNKGWLSFLLLALTFSFGVSRSSLAIYPAQPDVYTGMPTISPMAFHQPFAMNQQMFAPLMLQTGLMNHQEPITTTGQLDHVMAQAIVARQAQESLAINYQGLGTFGLGAQEASIGLPHLIRNVEYNNRIPDLMLGSSAAFY